VPAQIRRLRQRREMAGGRSYRLIHIGMTVITVIFWPVAPNCQPFSAEMALVVILIKTSLHFRA
jgi:hypothetical protein